jgi:hypothetical protein
MTPARRSSSMAPKRAKLDAYTPTAKHGAARRLSNTEVILFQILI